ncbi:MAG TPA: peptidase T [Candidatus Blautia stercorigallinarum]|uniref:Peptidase T n=1 Tax=Candidatus Blautia stercorigallinarum TaxID=2838501 RepID=A0A9D1PDF8_9FIRM|nr:peptidase T [Candidatus Blautia stercorigallinarum]
MTVAERFLKYIAVDTTSDPSSETFPSTKSQIDFANMLAEEMKTMGLENVTVDSYGYVFGTIPSTIDDYQGKILGFISHMDTSCAESGKNIRPRIIKDYDGKDIVLNEERKIVMSPRDFSNLAQYQGQDLIVTDGTTLLGGDDKAGIAEILTAAEYLLAHPEIPHGPIRVGFTPDEEIGQGTDHFDVEKFGADFAYTMDGGECGELEYENFNAAEGIVDFHGVSIHPGSAKGKMINSLRLAMEFEALMPSDQRPECTEGREGFIHLDALQGSVDHARSEYIIRDHDMDLFQAKKKHMEDMARTMNAKYGYEAVTLKIQDSYFNMKEKIEPHKFLIDNVLKVYEKLGIRPQIQPIRGGTDGAQLSFKGLPCPNLGTGDHNCHGHFEFACVQAMEKSVEVIIELIKLWQ